VNNVEEARVLIDNLLRKAAIRNHFHAGVMAALAAIDRFDSPEEQSAFISVAQDEYAEKQK